MLSIRGRPQRNAHLRSARAAGEEDETVHIISSSMEAAEEDERDEEEVMSGMRRP